MQPRHSWRTRWLVVATLGACGCNSSDGVSNDVADAASDADAEGQLGQDSSVAPNRDSGSEDAGLDDGDSGLETVATPRVGRIQTIEGGSSCAVLATQQVKCAEPGGQFALAGAAGFERVALWPVCALNGQGNIACEGSSVSLEGGPYVDLAVQQGRLLTVNAEGTIEIHEHGPAATVELANPPTGKGWVHVAAQKRWACAVRKDGHAECWGTSSDQRYTPEGRFRQATVGASHLCLLSTENEVRCWSWLVGSGSFLESAASMVQVSAGNQMTCALGEDFKAHCWGEQGYPDPTDDFTEVSAGSSSSCGIRKVDGALICWNHGGTTNWFGQTQWVGYRDP